MRGFGAMQQLYGWGIAVSSTYRITKKDKLQGQFSFGDGIAHYVVGFTGRQLDAIFNPENQTMELLTVDGGFITYSHYFTQTIWASLTYGLSNLRAKPFQDPTDFDHSSYFAVNVFYDPIQTIRVGGEITYGTRTNVNSEQGQNTRISAIFQFSF